MKKSTKILLTITGVVLAAAGMAALISPQGAADLLAYVVGLAVLLSGVATTATAFLPESAQQRRLLIGLAASDMLLGLLMLLIPKIPVLLLGVGVVLLGCSLVVVALQLKKQGSSWLGSMCAAVVAMVFGLALILFSKQIWEVIGVILGVALLAAGIILVIVGLSASKPSGEQNG